MSDTRCKCGNTKDRRMDMCCACRSKPVKIPCPDCGTVQIRKPLRNKSHLGICQKCSVKRRTESQQRTRKISKARCIDCRRLVSAGAKRCRTCGAKHAHQAYDASIHQPLDRPNRLPGLREPGGPLGDEDMDVDRRRAAAIDAVQQRIAAAKSAGPHWYHDLASVRNVAPPSLPRRSNDPLESDAEVAG